MRCKPFIQLLSLTLMALPSLYAGNTVIVALDDITVVIDTSSATKAAYLEEINKARASSQDCGEYGVMPPAPPLKWNDQLVYAAQIHSNDMAASNTFSHTGSGTSSDLVAQALHPGIGSTLAERVEYAGYTGWSTLGENIAAGYQTVQEVINGWINSPGHCRNLMSPAFTEVGMARADNSNSTYKTYWTQDFGAR